MQLYMVQKDTIQPDLPKSSVLRYFSPLDKFSAPLGEMQGLRLAYFIWVWGGGGWGWGVFGLVFFFFLLGFALPHHLTSTLHCRFCRTQVVSLYSVLKGLTST